MSQSLQKDNSFRPGIWGQLSAPVDAKETWLRIRAQSILSGGEIGQCPPLTFEQAKTVLAWYRPQH